MDHRIEKAQNLLDKEGIDALIIDHPTDLFYLTGVELSTGRLIVEKKGALLFVDGRYFELCQKRTSIPVELAKGQEKELLAGKKIGFDGSETSYLGYGQLKEFFSEENLVALDRPISFLRQVKEPEEIALMRKSGRLATKGFDYLLTVLKEGVTESALAKELEIFWLKEGGERLSFDSIIAFGENSSQPHYRSGERTLKRGEPALFDIGVVVERYRSDMTRVVFLESVTAEIEKIYKIVFEARETALKLCKPGIAAGDLDEAAREVVKNAGYGEYFPHGLGHGVGLDIHELPVLKAKGPYARTILEPNMVITIEPGIYLPGKGGVRLEEMVVVTEEGFENLLESTASPTPRIL